ncbi:EexN family lipoprotein [Bartonella krasnovii]|uniref:EexN family lipoprotein n=1 Tax=Bartonella krasnovii TaxID=2267275 RepID=A0ABY3W015_9HYPH|nr:EexN family lipoprotein [Bartonella krasnovii]UNF28896.1 EexN family lipoprotein [Bartonella krasnovii]UNF36890.1 EexN family lipoprotein [Bartonella krasnovii]
MNKVLITTLLLCTGVITAGCEKTYSVAEFKKNPKLMEEWNAKCGFAGTSKNCENLRLAQLELQKEYKAKAEERARKDDEKFQKMIRDSKAKMKADLEKMEAENQKFRAEQEAKRRAEEERRAKERAAKEQQNNN